MLSLINDHQTTDNTSYGIITVDKDVARLKIEPQHHDVVAQSVTLHKIYTRNAKATFLSVVTHLHVIVQACPFQRLSL